MKYNNKNSDSEIIEGCRKSNRLAQRVLYDRFFGRMYGIAMRYTSNQEEAIEILNAAFLKVFNSLDKYEDNNNLAGWIAKIVFNCAIDFVRKNTKYKQVINFNVEQDAPIQNDCISNLQTEDLFKLIQRLPEASRSVFCMYVIDGYKHKEIAEILDITEGTSKWHLSTARKDLQQMLERQRNFEYSSK